ncbi:hypothetical protein KHA80_19920 [Anaerobacillus sp. HL2]|nr:hypothetical protein KHA80_19920 [Anaerobacillus sp. HL2]
MKFSIQKRKELSHNQNSTVKIDDEMDDTYAPPAVETEDRLEQSSTAQILSLAKQGYSKLRTLPKN